MTDTDIRTSIEHADIRAEAVLEPWSGHGEGGNIAKVVIRGGEYGTYESAPAHFQRAKADAARINAALNAREMRAGCSECGAKWELDHDQYCQSNRHRLGEMGGGLAQKAEADTKRTLTDVTDIMRTSDSNDTPKSRRHTIENVIEDAVSDLLYYDRKEDEELPRGAIEEAIAAGEITIEQMVELFSTSLRAGLKS